MPSDNVIKIWIKHGRIDKLEEHGLYDEIKQIKQEKIDKREKAKRIIESLKVALQDLREHQDPEYFLSEVIDMDIIPPRIETKIEYVEKPLVTPEQKLMYNRLYYEDKKREKKLKEKEAINERRIQKALEREKSLCYKCIKGVKVSKPTYEIKVKRGRQIIKGKFICPECNTENSYYGGVLK